MFQIIYEHGVCKSAPFDKTIFNGMNNTIVRVISDNTDYVTTCTAISSYISKTIGESVYPHGTSDYKEAPNSLEITLQISFHY